MNRISKYFLSCVLLMWFGMILPSTATATAAPTVPVVKNPPSGYAYSDGDEFGLLQSNYSMGDFVRYTANPINVYYKSVQIPYTQDIKKYAMSVSDAHAADNLYNFVGYLYAGYAALNINPSATTKENWLTLFRTPGQGSSGSLGLFDNNKKCSSTVQLVDYTKTTSPVPNAYTQLAYKGGFGFTPHPTSVNAWYGFGNMKFVDSSIQDIKKYAIRGITACAWSTNAQSGNWVLAMPTSQVVPGAKPKFWRNNYNNVAAPYGQFFGARLSHILGAVVNDIPSTNSATPFMPTGTYQPQMAKMHGYAGTVPAGLSSPSTAHFGSLKNFLTSVDIPPRLQLIGSYLKNHMLPTVARLASVCSYGLSAQNLIQIQDASMTAYDNGVVVAIENNTGDQLTVHQVTQSSDNQIGVLHAGTTNHFLHTASMMSGGTPVAGNMIELRDKKVGLSVYLQVVTAPQLQTIVTNFNVGLNAVAQQTTDAMAYNQGHTFSPVAQAAYLLITNFDPATIATANVDQDEFLMYRMQAINLSEFALQPYFATLKIDKEKIGYGVEAQDGSPGAVPTPGSPGNLFILNHGATQTAMLYPSIVSVKTYNWQNPYAKQLNAGANPPIYYSAIPLLLMPETVLQANIAGLKSIYGIWLMAYAAALTEFQFNCNFGDNLDCLQNTFELFNVQTQQVPARVVIDARGFLQSGQSVVALQPSAESLQSTATYSALMGCDVWDIGNDFHQDIPVLNLYQDEQGNVATNQVGGKFSNFYVTVGSPKSVDSVTSFAQGYGAPYCDTMLYSIATSSLKQGVTGTLSQPKAGQYQLIFTDKLNNVLCVQKVFVDTKTHNLTPITIGFLNNQGAPWSATLQLPENIAAVKVGKSARFMLRYQGSATINTFQLINFGAAQNK